MEAFVNWLNNIVWSPALVYLCLGAGLYFFNSNEVFTSKACRRNGEADI
ncbi:hypothetical protein ACT7DH_02405 [Bacillus pacificus]